MLSRSPSVYVGAYSKTSFPVYLLAGDANHPRDFGKSLPAFRDLFSRVEIVKQRGYAVLSSPAPVQGGAAAGVTVPAPAATAVTPAGATVPAPAAATPAGVTLPSPGPVAPPPATPATEPARGN